MKFSSWVRPKSFIQKGEGCESRNSLGETEFLRHRSLLSSYSILVRQEPPSEAPPCHQDSVRAPVEYVGEQTEEDDEENGHGDRPEGPESLSAGNIRAAHGHDGRNDGDWHEQRPEHGDVAHAARLFVGDL